jgi:hypothetical protein
MSLAEIFAVAIASFAALVARSAALTDALARVRLMTPVR